MLNDSGQHEKNQTICNAALQKKISISDGKDGLNGRAQHELHKVGSIGTYEWKSPSALPCQSIEICRICTAEQRYNLA